jgi:hypothetical protein
MTTLTTAPTPARDRWLRALSAGRVFAMAELTEATRNHEWSAESTDAECHAAAAGFADDVRQWQGLLEAIGTARTVYEDAVWKTGDRERARQAAAVAVKTLHDVPAAAELLGGLVADDAETWLEW